MSSFKKEHDSDSEDEIENNNAVVEEEPEPEEDTSLANSDVVTKYQEAAKIAQAALQEVIAQVLKEPSIVHIAFHMFVVCCWCTCPRFVYLG